MGARECFEKTNDVLAKNISISWETFERAPMVQGRLPFTIRVRARQSETNPGNAVQCSQAAYSRQLPELAESLPVPESYGWNKESVILLAESKLDGSPLGSLRLQSNRHGKLGVERSVELPDWLRYRSLAEMTGLHISKGGTGRLVQAALIKAFHLYCLRSDIDWIVIAARRPLDRHYQALLYQDVYPGGEFIPMRHIGNIPHRVMAFEVTSGEARWAQADHPLFDFMCRTQHSDIELNDKDFNVPGHRMQRHQLH